MNGKATTTEREDGLTAPVQAGSRIGGLDAVRGVALFGILVANVRQIFLPWDIADFPVSINGNQRIAWIDWFLFHSLIDLKFLTLFSLLFGVGFALQSERLKSRSDRFAGIYLRRVLFLALFGIAHALLLYPAEVLMPYAVTALLLLAAHKVSTDNLFCIGLILLGATLVWAYQISALGEIFPLITALAVAALAASVIVLWRRNRIAALIVWTAIVAAAGGLMTLSFDGEAPGQAFDYQEAQKQLKAMISEDSAKSPAEFLVRRQENFGALISLHADQYADILFYFAILLLWRTLSLFMIGAGLFRSGIFTRATPHFWNRVAAIGLSIGLPMSLIATWLVGMEIRGLIDWRFPDLLHSLSALSLAAGIAGAVFVLHRRDSQRWLWNRIGEAGRMALTNYIGQSLIMAAIAERWGLNLYGRLGGPALTVLAVFVFMALVLFSHAWLLRFRMGPLEWLWRCGTYWRWLPIR